MAAGETEVGGVADLLEIHADVLDSDGRRAV